jgi:hypothetical protein
MSSFSEKRAVGGLLGQLALAENLVTTAFGRASG